VHAVIDALLGAAALGDIGKLFPDSDEKYAGANSIELLKRVSALIKESGFTVENTDATVLCERPKLRAYIDGMRHNIASALEIDPSRVSVKATTEEGLGFTGEGAGIAAHAVALLS
jgi:2-C-methyl-D-erythritol 2,4-cyclodiphosphate synthase